MKAGRTCSLPPAALLSLAKLQDGLNAMIDPNWRRVRSLENWSLAITMESTELLDSYPWKWWKNLHAKPDLDNVKIELVDIFHFSLSGSMQLQSMERDAVPERARKPLEEVFFPVKSSAEGAAPADRNGVLQLPLVTTANAVASFKNIIQLASFYRFDEITECVIYAAEDLGFNLVAYYVAKHTLNCIRQLGGYKDGSYVKVNNGVEDNVLLHECIAGIPLDEVIDENSFQKRWDEIMVSVYTAFQVPEGDRKDSAHWFKLAATQ